jgi:hypothetical protein
LEVKAGSALKQQVQFRLIPGNVLGMISSTTGPAATAHRCAAAAGCWVTDIMRTAGRGSAAALPSYWADLTWMGDRNSSSAGQ